MPDISRFFGIIIRMFAEPRSQHPGPHFHAYYGERVTVYSIDGAVEPLAGELPVRQHRLVEAWAELHLAALQQDWERLQSGRAPFSIDPLK